MKIAAVLGSPRKNGNEHEIDRINIVDFDVNGCLACGACMDVQDEPGCVQNDDVPSLFERLIEADAVVYASPLYCWGFTSQMKAFLDRHICLIKNYGGPDYKSFVGGKPVALLVTCAGPLENNADLIQQVFERIGHYGQCKIVGKHVLAGCTTPEELGDRARETAEALVRGFTGA